MGQHDLRHLGRILAAAQDEGPRARLDVDRGRQRLLESPRKRRPATRVRAAALVAAVALAAAFSLVWLRPDPLGFRVGSVPEAGTLGAWVAAPSGAELPMTFSDGTRFVLSASARARVVSADPSGAVVVVERGSLSAAVVHRADSRWRVDMGPFQVHVTGTQFDVAWDPEAELFSLALREGSVVVSGPVVGGARRVEPGETLTVSCKEQRMQLSGAGAPPPPANPAPAPPPIELPAVEPRVERSAPEPKRVPPAAAPEHGSAAGDYRVLAREGRYRDALVAAESKGYDKLCAASGAEDLLGLGDIARLAGNARRAAQAYESVRARFGGSAGAQTAAFLLGRLAFDGRRSYADAARWFSVYLAEQPGGAFAREAAGRLIEAEERSGNLAAARRAAARYLQAYPNGPHANKATSLMESH